ncbi:unnamed protein product [Chironomus riparius]|uniref:SH3 domain-containing protein n=1 Tax=Chironomus riparius TaxID=315576 RepID=A0A9P0NG74_9DIPT|nr:unnamed protein product [Chironomus riparius]
MGQNVSLKRPKISLTWVLREQQAQQETRNSIKSFNWNVKSNEKVLFKKTSKSNEKLFSEKYVSDNNLNDFRNTKKPNEEKKKDESRKSEKIKRFHETCCKQRNSPDSNYDRLTDCAKVKSLSQVNLTGKESSIYVTSAQSDSGVNRRYKRYRRKRSPKFGYNINNVNEFLSKCSLSNPANIPVVLSNASILYQTRTGRQVETPLPLGMVVNSIFKNQNWLYVQTPHAEEGYVNFHACLPLGIIQRPHSMTTNCWETNTDVFPNPLSGNLTDSEKEVQLHRSGARSEGRQTPKLKRRNPSRTCSEKYLDSLYLLASQPKIIDHAYAELKPTAQVSRCNQEKLNVNMSSKRKILLAITADFTSDLTIVKKGDVVRLLACKEYEDKIWYFIKNKDGSECYIPSSVATEFL